MIGQAVKEMHKQGDKISIVQACKWANISRRSWYYCSHKSKPKVNEHLASQIKDHIERHPSDGYRSVAWYLQLNKNTVQRIFQLKNWQVRKRRLGKRPRVETNPSVSDAPNKRWSTDMARIWCGSQDRWCTLSLVMDCCTRELLGWRLCKSGDAKGAQAALEEALINRYGTLLPSKDAITLRSDNGLVFTSKHYTKTVREYGLSQEFIRPHTSQQNGMIERLIRTIKEQCVFLHRFESLQDARRILGQWCKHYNNHRPHQALGMKTPSAFYKCAA